MESGSAPGAERTDRMLAEARDLMLPPRPSAANRPVLYACGALKRLDLIRVLHVGSRRYWRSRVSAGAAAEDLADLDFDLVGDRCRKGLARAVGLDAGIPRR